jgi:hypothetical protein
MENYLFDCDGKIRKIQGITIEGLRGTSPISKLASWFFGNWIVRLQISDPLDFSLSEIKSMISECVSNSIDMDESWLADERAIKPFLVRINGSSSAIELFNNLQLPPPENALDAL